ncbi:hypothetical protein L6164_028795 [Bauhinia variegata]|uniref:Uncharacterized protein n=1 Tax=Bauhinia variegata TaxID=167791 RepID=A0ACB9L7S7_BAUVA|nr:hypothetical protein L6164_028795 [Bauhinia variegata]
MSSPRLSSLHWRSLSVSSLSSWSSEPERSITEANGLEDSLLQLISDHNHASRIVRQQIGLFFFSFLSLSIWISMKLLLRISGFFPLINWDEYAVAEKAKKDAIGKAVHISNALVEAVNGGVRESFINEKRIEHEIRALVVSIARFMKQTDQWLAATHALNTAVKEIGDFENWMKIMEYDCKSVCAAIHNL